VNILFNLIFSGNYGNGRGERKRHPMNTLWMLFIAAALIAGAATGRVGALLPAMLEGSGRGVALALELAAPMGCGWVF
jgi:hypothetical protein